MSIGMMVLAVLGVGLVGVVPLWPYSRDWGYGPGSGLGLLVVMMAGLVMTSGA